MSNENKEDRIKEFTFNLSENVTYSNGSDQTESGYIVFTAPTSKNKKECRFLRQAFYRSINSLKSKNKDEDSTEKEINVDFKGSDIIDLFAMGSEDLDKICEAAERLFLNGVAEIGGEVKLTRPIMDRIDPEDLDEMIGEYLRNFILRSALNKMKTS